MGLTGGRVPTPLSGRRSRPAWPGIVRALVLVPAVILSGCASSLMPSGRLLNPGAGVLGQRARGQSSPLAPGADELGDLPPLPTGAAPAIPLTFPTPAPPEVAPAPERVEDAQIQPAACATCGQPTGMLPPLSVSEGGCATCGTGMCTPGSKPSYPWPAHTFVGRAFGELYQCLCCPDPCYEPRWVWEANAGFFLDWARLTGHFGAAMARHWHDIPTLMVSFGYPYYLYDAPRAPTYVNAYTTMVPMQQAVVDCLMGRALWNHHSPVDAFCGLPDARF